VVREAIGRGRDAAERGRKVVEHGSQEATQRGRKAVEYGASEAAERGRKAAKRGRKEARRVSSEQLSALAEPRRPRIMGFGLGGMAIVAAGSYLLWRLVRGGPAEPKPWYAG
jgi:hypothetical protein